MVHQDHQRNVTRGSIRKALALVPAVGFADVCDVLLLCAKENPRPPPTEGVYIRDMGRGKSRDVGRGGGGAPLR